MSVDMENVFYMCAYICMYIHIYMHINTERMPIFGINVNV